MGNESVKPNGRKPKSKTRTQLKLGGQEAKMILFNQFISYCCCNQTTRLYYLEFCHCKKQNIEKEHVNLHLLTSISK